MSIRTTVLNCPVDLCDSAYALSQVLHAVNSKQNYHIVTINPEMIMNAQENENFFKILNKSDLNIIDGVGVKIALKLKGINQEQIRGVDFARKLVEIANENDFKIGFLGAKEEVISKAIENFKKQYTNLNVVYSRNGYFNSDDEIIEEIVKAQPQILLVGLGSPKQEEFICKIKKDMPNTLFIGVGGSFDVWSNKVERAPEFWQKAGLEWLYRTVKEPARFKRIFPTLPLFVLRVVRERVCK